MWTAVERSIATPDGETLYRVIPVLLPNSTRGDRSKLPRFLRRNTWIEFRRSIEERETLERLVRDIRGEAPLSSGAVAVGECPYRGLAHFDVADAPQRDRRDGLGPLVRHRPLLRDRVRAALLCRPRPRARGAGPRLLIHSRAEHQRRRDAGRLRRCRWRPLR
jgi:hypothetical protein